MVRRHISNETKELALSMSLQGTSDLEIRKLTGISERSVKRLRRTYRNSGSVACKPVAPGRPRTLSSMEVKVRRVYLSHLPPQLILFPLLFSFFVIVSSGGLTCPSPSCRATSGKCVPLKSRWHVADGLADPSMGGVYYEIGAFPFTPCLLNTHICRSRGPF